MRLRRQVGHRLRLTVAAVFLVGLSAAAPVAAECRGDDCGDRGSADPGNTGALTDRLPLNARIVAVGIPGAGAISSVGTFLEGGPIHDLDTPAQPFLRTTRPGEILDPQRIVVASHSNYGQPHARTQELAGSIVSIDPNGPGPILIPPTFARGGGQASTAAGRVRLFTAQSPAFSNSMNNPSATTAAETAVSNPLGISINNAFGRLWFANAPTGLDGPGTSTVIDPTGRPLVGPPSLTAAGVFFGNLTNRSSGKGLGSGAVGTALLGPSPDGTHANNAAQTPRVVFATVTADGAVQQVHVQKGVDDLAPAGTISPLPRPRGSSATPGRVGVAWDGMCLFITDPVVNGIAVLMLTADTVSDTAMFHVKLNGSGHIPVAPGVLATPIDIAPTQPETHSHTTSSNTTLASGSDFYVANWGNNTIVRMNEDGVVSGVRQVVLGDYNLPGISWHLNGIGVSSDGTRIWATVVVKAPALGLDQGAVLELPAF